VCSRIAVAARETFTRESERLLYATVMSYKGKIVLNVLSIKWLYKKLWLVLQVERNILCFRFALAPS